ncbi:MAG: protease modulator HflK [Clostridia bacterium]|nr:protease modulator HflK [Clostridia bacterium]
MKKTNLFADILQTVTKYFGFLVAAVIIFILCSGIRVVGSGNKAIILRFGKLVGDTYEEQVHEPGLLLAFPYIIDEVIIVPTGSVIEQSVTTHYSGEDTGVTAQGGYVITGDRNIAVISASVKYVVSDPVKYALNVSNIESVINSAVSNAMVNEAASIGVDSLLTDGKDAYTKAVLSLAGKKLDKAGVGVTLNTIELTKVAMPEEVRAIYERVNSATVEAATLIEEANQYRENVIPEAQAYADSTVADANKEQSDKTSAASADLSEFWGVLEEYENNRENTATRIYTQKVTEFMNKIGKVRVVEDGETKIFLNE